MKIIKSFILFSSFAFTLTGCDIGLENVYKDQKALDNVISSPASIFDIKYESMLKQDHKIANTVIVTINDNLDIVDKDNRKISNFMSYYEKVDLKKTAFCVRIESDETAEKFVDKYEDNYKVQDLIVVSENKEVIKNVKKRVSYYGAAYDVSNVENLDYDAERMVANSIGAGILIINQSQIDNAKIRYTQNMAKCVWTYCDETSDADYYSCIASGTFGIISQNMNAYNRVFNEFGDYENKVLIHSQFNIAHRGDDHHYPENTIAACESAILGGAEALELDFHRTKDNSIVVMHDKTTDKTCDVGVVVNETTDQELRKINVIKGFGGEDLDPQPIPFFEDVADLMNKYPDVVLYAEIKSSDKEFPKLLTDAIKEYDLENRVVIIFFESLPHPFSEIPDAYYQCHALNPNLWGLDLMWLTISDISSIQFKNDHCCGYDCNLSTGFIIVKDYLQVMKNRGFLPSYWTLIDTEEDIDDFYRSETYGMTNNWPCAYKDFIKTLEYKGTIENKEANAEYTLTATTYGGETKEVTGKIICSDENDVIFNASTEEFSYIVRAGI